MKASLVFPLILQIVFILFILLFMDLCSCSWCKHMTVSMGFSSENGPEDKKGCEVGAGDLNTRETGCSRANGHSHLMEIDREFVPIEHPLEPPDEDRPLKCPMPNSSVPNNEGMKKERSIESFRKKRVELPVAYEEEMVISPEPPAVRKRHHARTPDYAVPLLLGTSQQQCSVFQMLQECNEYES